MKNISSIGICPNLFINWYSFLSKCFINVLYWLVNKCIEHHIPQYITFEKKIVENENNMENILNCSNIEYVYIKWESTILYFFFPKVNIFFNIQTNKLSFWHLGLMLSHLFGLICFYCVEKSVKCFYIILNEWYMFAWWYIWILQWKAKQNILKWVEVREVVKIFMYPHYDVFCLLCLLLSITLPFNVNTITGDTHIKKKENTKKNVLCV